MRYNRFFFTFGGMTKGKGLPLYAKVLIGMGLGLLWGLVAVPLGFGDFTRNWIHPFGNIFISSLKLIAVPLVIVSLIDGVSSLSDVGKLSRMGGRTLLFYMITLVISATVGILGVNAVNPGQHLPEERRDELRSMFASGVNLNVAEAHGANDHGPLQMLEDMVPSNLFLSLSDNANMLQVIFFALLFGVAMIMSPREKIAPVKDFFGSVNTVILSIVDIIMRYAPIGVFALLASLNIDLELLQALSVYGLTVVMCLAVMMLAVYPLLLKAFSNTGYLKFSKAILPAQILGFSTSSGAATLPVTMDCMERGLKVPEDVSSFVLPLGATVNMDGTCIHQAVSAVFIAQAFGIDLTLSQQLTILATSILASIGAAAVPGAGIIMLVIVLESVGLDPAGLALIIAIDRPLDMLRTAVNITGDCVVTSIISDYELKRRATEISASAAKA